MDEWSFPATSRGTRLAMYIGFSIFLIALGAILTFALTTSAEGFNINTAGWILMIAGALGVVLSLLVLGRERDPADRPPA